MTYIFQAKPTIFELREKLIKGEKIGWLASSYYNEMQVGDIVYFWRAGEKRYRGLYGWGLIVHPGVFKDKNELYRVAVLTKKVFKKEGKIIHISFEDFKNNSILNDMRLMQMAMGTNFKLTEEEVKQIDQLIKIRIGEEWLPGHNN